MYSFAITALVYVVRYFFDVGLSAKVFYRENPSKTSKIVAVKFLHEKSICLCHRNPKLDMPLFCLGFVSLILRAGWE